MYTLYRKGHKHEVNGVKCEQIRVTLGELDDYRKDGWVDDLEDINKKDKANDNKQHQK